MTTAAPLHYLSISQAAQRLRSGQLTSLELVNACLDRIATQDGELNAFITVSAERARQKARAADQQRQAGQDLGPLHGIPIAHKDMLLTAGERTTAASALLQDWVPTQDAAVVQQLQRAGAISLGKTNCHEFAFGSPLPGDLFPPARNPWNTAHMPGSSSSGSGAAVAAGLVMAATGTDTGGSVRHPAAACGVVGMKPTYGLISLEGVLPLAPSMDHVGPLTRSVADNALMLQAMAGPGAPDFSARLGQPLRGMTLGVPRQAIAAEAHDPEVLAAFEEALRVLQGLGARLVDVAPAGLAQAPEFANLIIAYEAHAQHAQTLRTQPDKLGLALRQRLALGAACSEAAYQAALAGAAVLRERYADLFASSVDAVLSPGREFPAETLQALMAAPTGRRSTCNRVYSLTGAPALTLPMCWSSTSLPLALQMATAHQQEALLYQLAHAYETAAGWAGQHPP